LIVLKSLAKGNAFEASASGSVELEQLSPVLLFCVLES